MALSIGLDLTLLFAPLLQDEERVQKNALNLYTKDKSEGSVTGFSTVSGASEDHDSDDSGSSDGKSKFSKRSGKSEKTNKTGGSGGSRSSNKSKSKSDAKSEHSVTSGSSKRSKAKSVKSSSSGDAADADEASVSSEEGGQSSVELGAGRTEVDEAAAAAQYVSEEDMPLMKETEHIPHIRQRLVEEKIKAVLTACYHGELDQVDSLLSGSEEVTIASKDSVDRTPLHIAASEGHEEVVRHLLELKADPSAKDRVGKFSRGAASR